MSAGSLARFDRAQQRQPFGIALPPKNVFEVLRGGHQFARHLLLACRESSRMEGHGHAAKLCQALCEIGRDA